MKTHSLPSKKILLVDDDPDFVEATKAVLEGTYQVVTAYNGNEGLEKVESERPDLILLDLMMPEKDGFRLCKELKGNPKYADIPVLVLTALSEKLTETRYAVSMGLELELEDYVDKPISPQELLERVRDHLGE